MNALRVVGVGLADLTTESCIVFGAFCRREHSVIGGPLARARRFQRRQHSAVGRGCVDRTVTIRIDPQLVDIELHSASYGGERARSYGCTRMTARLRAALPRSCRRRVCARLVGRRLSTGVEAWNRTHQVASRLESEGACKLVRHLESRHVTSSAQAWVLVGRMRPEDARRVVGEAGGTISRIAEEHGSLRSVRRVRCRVGHSPSQVTLHAKILFRIGRRDREPKLRCILGAVGVVTYGAGNRLIVGCGSFLLEVVRNTKSRERATSFVTAYAR